MNDEQNAPAQRDPLDHLLEQAAERGHGQRTQYATAGGALGALVGSFFGPGGAAVGAAVGAGAGALIGDAQDAE